MEKVLQDLTVSQLRQIKGNLKIELNTVPLPEITKSTLG